MWLFSAYTLSVFEGVNLLIFLPIMGSLSLLVLHFVQFSFSTLADYNIGHK